MKYNKSEKQIKKEALRLEKIEASKKAKAEAKQARMDAKEAEINQIMLDYNLTYSTAKEVYSFLHANSERSRTIKDIMSTYNCEYSKAKYIYNQTHKKGCEYHERPNCAGLTYAEVKDYSISRSEQPGGWKVFKKGVEIPVVSMKANKSTGMKRYYVQEYLGCTKVNGEWKTNMKMIPLASLVYVKLRFTDVPKGYVVDHINENTEDNSPDNLRLLTHKANVKIRTVKTNQYTK